MWDGEYTSDHYVPVRGATLSRVGNWVCVSGSRSGANCGARVFATDALSSNGIYPIVKAQEPNGAQVAGRGDSGGAVYELPYSPDSTGSVIAKGIHLNGRPNADCVIGERDGRQCHSEIGYADIVQFTEAHGAKILTDWQNAGGERRPGSLDGDNNAELIGVNLNGDGTIVAWRNGGNAAWIGPTPSIGSGWWNRASVRFADLDGDRKDDLIGVNVSGDGLIRAFRNVDGINGNWDGPYYVGSGWTNPAVARFADIDGDGRDDLISVNADGSGKILAYRNNGHAFQAWPWTDPAPIGYGWSNADTVRFADINGDGADDLIGINNWSNGAITVWPNNQLVNSLNWGTWPWTNTSYTIGAGWYNPSLVRFADINGDGYDDLIGVNMGGDGTIRAWRNNKGAWGWPWGTEGIIGSGWWTSAAAQFA
jgi:hypothetical protein